MPAARGAGGLSVRGEERPKRLISEQRVQLIGQPQVPITLGKRGAGDPGGFRGDGFDRHRAKHGAPPSLGMKPSRCRGIVPVLERLRQQYHFW